MAKKIPQINASSMADISFLLLIFFLVTTSMDVNQGLARRLPAPIPPDMKIEDKDINKRNLLVVKINSANQLMVQGQLTDVKQLRAKAKEFIQNKNNDERHCACPPHGGIGRRPYGAHSRNSRRRFRRCARKAPGSKA